MTDSDESPLSELEIAELKTHAAAAKRTWLKRFLIFMALLGLCCAAIAPFSAGMPLHSHAEPYARILVYLAMALFAAAIYSGAMIFYCMVSLRETLDSYRKE